MATRVLIIDGHPAVGRGLRALLEATPGLDVVGLADCPVRGLWQAVTAPPDVVLVDADMPGLASCAAIRLLRARSPETRVVALGIYPSRRSMALAAGAHAFVLKDAGFEALRDAIDGDRAARPAAASWSVTTSPPSTAPSAAAEEIPL